ncbi:MAG: flagellar biosynthesis anti-sigma factor FlgM [Fibrobacterales bacterium]
MRITDVAIQTGGVESLKKVAGAKPVDKPNQAKAKSDSVTISDNAKKLSTEDSEVLNAKARVKATPEVRQDRIDAVKERIASGYYDSEEFQDKLADRLMNEFGIKE